MNVVFDKLVFIFIVEEKMIRPALTEILTETNLGNS